MPTGIITGGVSGLGLAVAQALVTKDPSWKLHLVDLNTAAASSALATVPNAEYHCCNVTDYARLAAIFQAVFRSSGRQIDFVFANAGIVEKDSFYGPRPVMKSDSKQEGGDDDAPPAPIPKLVVDINLLSVIDTVQLSLHYMRLSRSKGRGCSILATASCGGLYPTYYVPIYAATKHAVVGLVRSAHDRIFVQDGIRLNAICPGSVRTGLIKQEEWKKFPEDCFTPMEMVTKIVLGLVLSPEEGESEELADAWGEKVKRGECHGLTVELNGTNSYFRKQPEYSDDKMAKLMAATREQILDTSAE